MPFSLLPLILVLLQFWTPTPHFPLFVLASFNSLGFHDLVRPSVCILPLSLFLSISSFPLSPSLFLSFLLSLFLSLSLSFNFARLLSTETSLTSLMPHLRLIFSCQLLFLSSASSLYPFSSSLASLSSSYFPHFFLLATTMED